MHRRSTKRADIQAMRALAVGIVLLYHLWPNWMPGGFIGVDVFFVISGYLITSHIVNSMGHERPQDFLVRFYARRVRRLAPAAVVVLIFVLTTSIAFLPVSTWVNTARQIIGSALFFENWLLAGDAVNYLAADNDPTAMQHFWSLSVEEQFYIVWPLLLLLATISAVKPGSPKKLVLLIIASIATLSFAWSLYETTTVPAAAYFVTQARVWQLATGGLLAFVRLRNRRLRLVLPWFGVGVVAVCALFLTAALHYPGYWAIAPVAGAALIIVGGGDSESAFSMDRASQFPPVQWLGDASYSVYLWHWPLIVLLPLVFGVRLGTPLKVVIVILTLLIAWGSYNWIENSARRSSFLGDRPLRSIFAGIAALTIVVTLSYFAIGFSTTVIAKSKDAFTAVVEHPDSCLGAAALDNASCDNPWGKVDPRLIAAAPGDRPLPWIDHCSNGLGKDSHALCKYGDPHGTRTILLWGDSHAGAWAPAFDAAGKLDHFKLIVAMRHGCPASLIAPVATVGRKVARAEQRYCLARDRWVLNRVVPKADQIVLANMTTNYIYSGENQIKGYTMLLDLLERAGKPIIMMQDIPLTGDDKGHRRNAPACLAEFFANCTNPARAALNTTKVARSLIDAGYGAALKYVRTADRFCKDGLCYYAIGGVSVYFDASHLSNTYSASLGPWLVCALRTAKPLGASM